MTATVEPEGVTTGATWDGADRLLTETNGENETTTYTYEGDERAPTTVTDPLGHTTVYDVGADGLVDSVTDPDGVTTTFEYNLDRTLHRQIDDRARPRSSRTTAWGAARGRRPRRGSSRRGTRRAGAGDGHRDGAGAETVTTYTPSGRVETVTRKAGVGEGPDAVTEHGYDDAGRLAREVDARDNITTYGYDADGNLTETHRPIAKAGDPVPLTTRTYDELGRLKTRSTRPGSRRATPTTTTAT